MLKKFFYHHKIVSVCAAFSLIVFIVTFILFIRYDQKYGYHFPTEEFVPNQKNDPYAQEIPLYEMNFWEYLIDFPADALIYVEYNMMLTLPCNIDYYERKEDTTPALTLEKGTIVCLFPGKGYPSKALVGYGMVCWPDYEEEWRYGCPFISEDIPYIVWRYGKNYVRAQTMYYVKSEQLEEVAGEFYKQNKDKWDSMFSLRAYRKFATQYIDRILYTDGDFCPERWRN